MYQVNLNFKYHSGDCDFEDFILCGYIQDAHYDNFDWIRGHGSTRTERTGPKTDHTKGDMSGKLKIGTTYF